MPVLSGFPPLPEGEGTVRCRCYPVFPLSLWERAGVRGKKLRFNLYQAVFHPRVKMRD